MVHFNDYEPKTKYLIKQKVKKLLERLKYLDIIVVHYTTDISFVKSNNMGLFINLDNEYVRLAKLKEIQFEIEKRFLIE